MKSIGIGMWEKAFFHISLCCKIGIFMWVALLLFLSLILFKASKYPCCEDSFDAQRSAFGKLCSH